MELQKLHNEYDEHVADQNFEAEYRNIIKFQDKVVATTSS